MFGLNRFGLSNLMTLRWQWAKFGSSTFMAAAVFAFGLCAASPCAYAGDTAATEAKGVFIPGADGTTNRPLAAFFTINQVLAKFDRQRGKGAGATRMAALTPSNVATDGLPALNESPPASKAPFGVVAFRAPEGILWHKWRALEADISEDHAVLEHCRTSPDACRPNAAQFLQLITAVRARSGRGQLDEANRAVNMVIRYVSDFAQHGEADHWSAALATFATRKGDCEDYAIAKYVALTEAGFPRDDLQLVLLRNRAARQDHAVLAARLDGRWLLLDNRFSTLTEDPDASGFTPLFAIDHQGVHLIVAPYAKRQVLTGETEAAPAAAGDGTADEWTSN
jgi:predicted transglutaminase-like cysteine proteinase